MDELNVYDMQPAFVGMLADSMFKNTDTLPAGTNIPFGCLAGIDATTGRAVLPVGANPAGIAQHSHVIDYLGDGKYLPQQAVSLLTRGRIWARSGGTCTKDGPAKYNPTTGVFSDSGSATLTGARFKTANLSFGGINPGLDPNQNVVLVELDHPFTGAPAAAP